MNYEKKYIKYKNKYIDLKNQLGGDNINSIGDLKKGRYMWEITHHKWIFLGQILSDKLIFENIKGKETKQTSEVKVDVSNHDPITLKFKGIGKKREITTRNYLVEDSTFIGNLLKLTKLKYVPADNLINNILFNAPPTEKDHVLLVDGDNILQTEMNLKSVSKIINKEIHLFIFCKSYFDNGRCKPANIKLFIKLLNKCLPQSTKIINCKLIPSLFPQSIGNS